jgi:hypothetical protein
MLMIVSIYLKKNLHRGVLEGFHGYIVINFWSSVVVVVFIIKNPLVFGLIIVFFEAADLS